MYNSYNLHVAFLYLHHAQDDILNLKTTLYESKLTSDGGETLHRVLINFIRSFGRDNFPHNKSGMDTSNSGTVLNFGFVGVLVGL